MYSSRQAKIIMFYLCRDEYVTYQEISKELQISSRTIMRELNQIKDSLQKNHLQIHSLKGKGIRLIGEDADKQNLMMDIQGSKIDYMDKEERQELLSLELLRNKEIQKLFYYSNKFQVSEATISHDLDDLETFFKTYHIQLIRRPGYGVGVTGDETHIRQAISVIINKTVQRQIVDIDFDRYDIEDVTNNILSSQNNPGLKKLIDTQILTKILEVFKAHHEELELDTIAKSSYMGLLIHLMIAVNRIQENRPMSDNQEIYNLINDENAYAKAKKLMTYLSQAFDITFEKTECAFIAIHLQTAKPAVIDQESSTEEYSDIIYKMLMVFNEAGYNLLSDYELYQSLTAHLKPALIRLEYGLPIYNPMLKEIKENFTEIFNITKQASRVIESTYHHAMNDDEIGYLALHFAAGIERYKTTHLRPIQVGVICSSGIGLSSLLIARIKRIVDYNVHLVPLSITDIENTLYVTPLLNQNDVVSILKAIEEKRKHKQVKQTKKEKYDLLEIAETIKNIIQQMKLIILNANTNKYDLILSGCKQVTQNPILIQQILKREEKGSNIYHSFHFALLHTTTSLVNDCIVHIIQPDQHYFINEELHDIEIALLMLIPENGKEYQKRLMSYISAQLLENAEFIKQLHDHNENQIKEMFNTLLQNWMLDYIKEEEKIGIY